MRSPKSRSRIEKLLKKARQAVPDYCLHPRKMQHGMHFTGAPLGLLRLLIGYRSQILIHLFAAAQERARHVVAQNQHLGHFVWRDHVAVDAPVDLERRQGPQQHAPLIRVGHRDRIGPGLKSL